MCMYISIMFLYMYPHKHSHTRTFAQIYAQRNVYVYAFICIHVYCLCLSYINGLIFSTCVAMQFDPYSTNTPVSLSLSLSHTHTHTRMRMCVLFVYTHMHTHTHARQVQSAAIALDRHHTLQSLSDRFPIHFEFCESDSIQSPCSGWFFWKRTCSRFVRVHFQILRCEKPIQPWIPSHHLVWISGLADEFGSGIPVRWFDAILLCTYYIYTYIYIYIYVCVCAYVRVWIHAYIRDMHIYLCLVHIHAYMYDMHICSKDFILKNPILRTRSCGIGFITQPGWVYDFLQTTLVWWKWFVLAVYQ